MLGNVDAVPEPSNAPRSATARALGAAMLVLSGLQLMVVLDGTVANLALAPLQADLLAGRLDPSRLGAIAALAEGETAADPALAAVLAAVALRARVELARHGYTRLSSPD